MKQGISGYTRLAGVIANPIKHSLSPMIHNYGYQQTGVDAVYLAFEVERQDFLQTLETVKLFNMLGVNISMPYKKQAYDACDTVSEVAALIGNVNTIVQKKGQLIGYNTDGLGFIESLKEKDVSIEGKSLMILGAGGAARAIICQCALLGTKEINVFKRKNETYKQQEIELQEIARKTQTMIVLHDFNDDDKRNQVIEKSDIIVNATQLGMGEDDRMPFDDFSKVTKQHVLVDLIYHPLETRWLKKANDKGIKTINGLGMLVHQGALAFNLMTQKDLPVKSLLQDIEQLMEKKKEN